MSLVDVYRCERAVAERLDLLGMQVQKIWVVSHLALRLPPVPCRSPSASFIPPRSA